MSLKMYLVSVLGSPESGRIVITYYRNRAYKLYLQRCGKNTATLLSEKVDCSVLLKKECVI